MLSACSVEPTGVFGGIPRNWGTQRAVLSVSSPASVGVLAQIPWRRYDEVPVPKVLMTGPGGVSVTGPKVVLSSGDSAWVHFSATASGEYHVYWLPYNEVATGGTCEQRYLTEDGGGGRYQQRRRGLNHGRSLAISEPRFAGLNSSSVLPGSPVRMPRAPHTFENAPSFLLKMSVPPQC